MIPHMLGAKGTYKTGSVFEPEVEAVDGLVYFVKLFLHGEDEAVARLYHGR